MRKAAIYTPYLDTYGGGEKYMMTIAEILSENFDVDVFLDTHLILKDKLKNTLLERFNLNLKKVNFIKAPIGKESNFFERLFFLKKYYILFYLTDGSIFFPTAQKNILHIQSPLVGQPAVSLWGKVKLKGWNLIIYNSKFTQDNSQNNWPINSEVIYPPVDVNKIKPLKKKKYILSVGRFFGYLKDKKHELLIHTFRELCESMKLEGWVLNLVGSASDGDKPYLDQLRNLAKDLPIKFYPNRDYNDLIKLYGESSIYWHAAGFGEGDPTKMEHFGISTVEAMAGGVIPVVIGKGGQREIIEDKKSGFLWDTLDQLKQYTIELIRSDILRRKISLASQKRALIFSKQKFQDKILEIVK